MSIGKKIHTKFLTSFILGCCLIHNVFAIGQIEIKKSQDTLRPDHRIRNTALLHGGIYGGSMTALYFAWYKNYTTSTFRFFNDDAEWLQMDKVGHGFSAYIMSRYSMELWKHSGISERKAVWLGGLSGAAFQTIIEIQDGFSSQWGWSWGDIAANLAGSGLLIGQELGWKEQRIQWKISMHRNPYSDSTLNNRADQIFGRSLPERLLKDYNAQTYWLSANLNSFFPRSSIPKWLNVAVGYGVDGVWGARSNLAYDNRGQVVFDRRDIARKRQWYLAPDIDFSKIKTNKKSFKTIFLILNALKFPSPALEFSSGKIKWNWIQF